MTSLFSSANEKMDRNAEDRFTWRLFLCVMQFLLAGRGVLEINRLLWFVFALQSEMELRKRGEVVALSRERVGEGAKCLTVAIRTSLKETSVSCVGGLGKPRQW